jgi:type VI secretion system protein ImpD
MTSGSIPETTESPAGPNGAGKDSAAPASRGIDDWIAAVVADSRIRYREATGKDEPPTDDDSSDDSPPADDSISSWSVEKTLVWWLAGRQERGRLPTDARHVAMLVNRDVARIDQLLNEQVNAILHNPRFQRLESSWRGLRYLVERSDGVSNMQIRAIHATWKEISRDLELAIEFDQSALFDKIYSSEFGIAGGTPYTTIIGDYEIRHRPSNEHPFDDVGTLMGISQVAASAFAPFIAGVHPAMLGMDGFHSLERQPNLRRQFEQMEYLKWRALRHTEDARFVGLALPRILMRLPYLDDAHESDGFVFREDVTAADGSGYLWGNAAWAFGGVLIRAFDDSGWFADIRGVTRGEEDGGLVVGLPVQSFRTDQPGVVQKSSVEVALADRQERELAELGLVPLCDCPDVEYSVFYSNQSVQKPRAYDTTLATTNARMSAMLQYMLCTSRFAHYVKVIARDKIGAFADPQGLQSFLHSWIQRYVAPDPKMSAKDKAKFPLRQAKISVREHPGKPGSFLTDIFLWPHFQLDELSASVKLVTELVSPGK